MELLTLQQIAERLNMAPSTVRYYRTKYKDFMPEVNAGRYAKFQPEAIEIIKDIAAATAATKQQQEIIEMLSAKYALNIDENEKGESVATTATTTATTKQQQTDNISIVIYRERINDLLQHNCDLKSEVEFLRDELIYKDSILLKTQQQLDRALLPWWKKIL